MAAFKQTELPWIAEARKHIGLAEIPGKQHNPTITNWLATLKAWWRDDETPWCGTFVAHCCRSAKRGLPQHWYRAKDWLNTGTRLSKPAYGCIAVFDRKGGGHVGFVVGRAADGGLMVLGGNQGNRVSIAKFAPQRVSAFIWPDNEAGKVSPTAERYRLPRLDGSSGYSSNEA